MKICDLHTHSTCSDGADSPEELLDLAIKANLSAIALTDHNNIEGITAFKNHAKGKDIAAIGGCEFSVDYEGKELHLIGMFIDDDKLDIVRNYLEDFKKAKVQCNYDTIQRFKDAGYPVDVEEFKKTLIAPVPNRVHIANYLMSKGVVKSKEDAFDNWLQDGGRFYKSPAKPDFNKTIDFIHSIGAVAVWAHPLFHVNMERCVEILKTSPKLDGMECYYTTYNKEETEWSLKTAEEFGIIVSGGSDYHGKNKADVQLAKGHGDLAVPYSCYENLAKRKANL